MAELWKDINSRGLCEHQVTESRKKYGANVLREHKKQTFMGRFFANFGDPIIKILLIALGFNLLFMFRNMNIAETVGIIAAILLATFISTVSEYGSEVAFERMKREAEETYCRVIRDGATYSVPITDIVVGDIIHIGAGERVPCDCIIISGEVSVDQSVINGESKETKKLPFGGENIPIPSLSDNSSLMRGCVITVGDCIAYAARVGEATEYGKLALEIQEDTRESPLKVKLSALAGAISKLGYTAAALIAIAYLFNIYVIECNFTANLILEKLTDTHFLLDSLTHALTLGITVIVVAVPEGLPMMITVVLSSNMKRMMKDNVLVRKLVGIETAGSLNILFCDKTGTLTEGKMQTSAYLTFPKPECEIEPDKISAHGKIGRLTALSSRLNTECDEAGGGNATDRALFRDFANTDVSGINILSRIPFDSKYKFSAVKLGGGEDLTLIKGAPEIILASATQYMTEDGMAHPFDSKLKIHTQNIIRAHCGRASRLIAIAICGKEVKVGEKLPSLTLVSLAVIRDNIRPAVPPSLHEMKKAGIQVVMITGDNRDTARAAAISSGLISQDSRALILTGNELSMLSDKELDECLPRIRVIARALPSDKSRLVRSAQRLGLVAGMTGDGVNDAPALKIADVGFAMGSGTEVAKEAGDIVILDNNFSSIAKAILYGRTIFKSIRKFIVFQLTMNFCAVGISLIGPFIGIDTPVTVIQMLWVNIIMDTLGGLAFAGEAPKQDYMREKPKRRDEKILNRSMLEQIIYGSIFTLGLSVFYLVSPITRSYFEFDYDIVRFMTGFFALFIFSSVLNCFNTRTHRLNLLSGLRDNKPFIVIIIFIIAVEMLMLYFGGSVFRTDGLTLGELVCVLALAFTVIPGDIIRKIYSRLSGNAFGY